MEFVYLLVVKGNLKHRIQKLGTEVHKDDLTDIQKVLRKIAEDQRWGSFPPERPSWANGAFLYLTREHAGLIKGAVERQGVHLQSKHILVSPTHRGVLSAALSARPASYGREAFLVARAGMIQTETRLVLLPPTTLPAAEQQCASSSWQGSKDTATEDRCSGDISPSRTISRTERISRQPSGHRCGDQRLEAVAVERLGFLKALDHNVLMECLTLDVGDVMDDAKKVDTLSFVTAPVSVQELAIRNWEQTNDEVDQHENPRAFYVHLWELACLENRFLVMRKTKDLLARYPFCVDCGKRAEVTHLQSKAHRNRVAGNKRARGEVGLRGDVHVHGPLLLELLGKDVPAGSDVARIFQQSTPTKCATEGCTLPAGGKHSGSEDYCCRWCEKPNEIPRATKRWKLLVQNRPRKHDCRCTRNFVCVNATRSTSGGSPVPPARPAYWGCVPPPPPPLPEAERLWYSKYPIQLQ